MRRRRRKRQELGQVGEAVPRGQQEGFSWTPEEWAGEFWGDHQPPWATPAAIPLALLVAFHRAGS